MTSAPAYRTLEELEGFLDQMRLAPSDQGRVALVVRRPSQGVREVLLEGALDIDRGLAGDDWESRGSRHTPDGSPHPEKQVTVMNHRFAAFLAGSPERVPLAGDQLYVDLDLSLGNLPAGSLLAVGGAVIEVTAAPHTGCAKFIQRFGEAAMRFTGSRAGRELRLRGLNARVVTGGVVRPGDLVSKLPPVSACSTPPTG